MPSPLVSPSWLASRLSACRIVDASWYLPAMKRDALAEYQAQRIPGAVYFDLDSQTDDMSGLPHMLPSARFFSEAMTTLGISNSDHVVCYDGKGIFSAPRFWWMMRAMGHERVSVLNGGLPAWLEAGNAVETAVPSKPLPPAEAYVAQPLGGALCTLQQLSANLKAAPDEALPVIDARPSERFSGKASEPRAGLRSGHIPGSLNVPFGALIGESGTLRPAAELRTAFEAAGVPLDSSSPMVVTCGSGVTAAVLALGLEELEQQGIKLYDGSWSEWGQESLDTPVATSD